MFVNLKIDKINEILVVHKLLNTNKLKAKKTYIERLSFQCTSYLWVNGSCYEGTLPLRCGTTLEEAVSWVDVGASSWLASNDMLLSSLLLEQLAAIVCSFFPMHLYKFDEYLHIKFDFFFKIRQHLLYTRDYPEFLILQIDKIYATNQLILIYVYQRDNVFNPKLTIIVFN
jgi:hypothetical protein